MLNCLISSFYIKPQLLRFLFRTLSIVLYRLSTSNHNDKKYLIIQFSIVLYRLSTSNHNFSLSTTFTVALSYIVFLHQTTTHVLCLLNSFNCLISSFYIKPQLLIKVLKPIENCLISSFYIKPQHHLIS